MMKRVLPQKVEKLKMLKNPLVAAKVRKKQISKIAKMFENHVCHQEGKNVKL